MDKEGTISRFFVGDSGLVKHEIIKYVSQSELPAKLSWQFSDISIRGPWIFHQVFYRFEVGGQFF